jgi:glycosyltransferase involved in cell wall biosynthesis
MKVLFLAPRFNESAGDGVYAVRLAQTFLDKGVQVCVLSAREERFELINCTDAFQGAAEDSNLLDGFAATDSGIFGKNFYSRSARSSLKQVLKQVKPDLIHVHGIHQVFTLSCMLELKRYGAPVVMTVHDYKIVCGNASLFSDSTEAPCTRCLCGAVAPPIFERCKKNSLLASAGAAVQMAGWKYTYALDTVDRFLVGSRFVFDLLSANRRVAKRLSLCRFPYSPLEAINNSSDNGTSVSFIGRLVPHKGFSIFANAVLDLQVPIHIFGDGDLLESAKRMLQGNPAARFHGWTSQHEMSKYLSPGSIVVVPSLAYETFCYVVVEAMMRGCCVVASGRGGITELIESGRNGLIVDPPTPEGFRDAIKMLLADRSKVITMGRQAASITDELPTLESHGEAILDVYRSISIGEPLA